MSDRGASWETGPATSASESTASLQRETLPSPQSDGWTHIGAILPRVVERMAACPDGCPSWSTVTDLALELQNFREEVARVDADKIEFVAYRRWQFYKAIGGSEKTLASFRAETRDEMAELRGYAIPPPALDWEPDAIEPVAQRPKGQRRLLRVAS